MDNLLVKVIAMAAIVLIIITIFFGPKLLRRRARARRAAAMSKVSAEQGWSYVGDGEAMLPLVRHLPRSYGTAVDRVTNKLVGIDGATRLPVGAAITDVIEGQVGGRDVQIFSWYAALGTPQGGTSWIYRHTVWALDLDRVPFWVQAATKAQPWDEWQPGTWFATGDGEFDAKFRVTCADATHLHAALPPQTRRMLLDSGFDGWRLDAEHHVLLVWTYSARRHTPPERLPELTRRAVQLAAAATDVLAA